MNNNFMLAIAVILGIGCVITAVIKINKPIETVVIQEIQPIIPPIIESKPEPPKPEPIAPPINTKPQSYQEAIKLAQQQNKQVFLYFGADWCPYCVKMKNETLQNAQVISALDQFIVYQINTDREKSIAQKYNVSSIPAYAIINNSENVLKSGKGFKNPREFERWLSGGIR